MKPAKFPMADLPVPAAGLLTRLMRCSLSAETWSQHRRGWRRELAAQVVSPATSERTEWVGTRETGVIAVPRDG